QEVLMAAHALAGARRGLHCLLVEAKQFLAGFDDRMGGVVVRELAQFERLAVPRDLLAQPGQFSLVLPEGGGNRLHAFLFRGRSGEAAGPGERLFEVFLCGLDGGKAARLGVEQVDETVVAQVADVNDQILGCLEAGDVPRDDAGGGFLEPADVPGTGEAGPAQNYADEDGGCRDLKDYPAAHDGGFLGGPGLIIPPAEVPVQASRMQWTVRACCSSALSLRSASTAASKS